MLDEELLNFIRTNLMSPTLMRFDQKGDPPLAPAELHLASMFELV